MNTQHDPNYAAQISAIDSMLDPVIEFGLEAEVVYSALLYIKEHPETSPVEAFTMGVAEWLK